MPVVDVALLPEHLTQHAINTHTLIVVDVLRASTTIISALDAGAKQIHPVLEIEDAFAAAKSIQDAILCGERHGVPQDGFHLGNSPAEYTPDIVQGQTLVLTTTNGTRALSMLGESSVVLIGAITNRTAVCTAASGFMADITIICAGTTGAVSLDETIAAGLMITCLNHLGYQSTETAQIIDRSTKQIITETGTIESALRSTRHAYRLQELGMTHDVQLAARLDSSNSVPRYNPKNRTISLT